MISYQHFTHLAECWMHIRAKFDGGKQINRSQRGSWNARCAGAALRYNEGPTWGPTCWEKVTSNPPNNVFVEKSLAHQQQTLKLITT